MAFKLYRTLDGASPPFEYYLMTDSEACTLGEALVQTSGRLTKCGATATPQFIAVKSQAAETTAVTPVPVIRVTQEQEWSNTANATAAVTLVGNKVTLHTDGLVVTATTASGVFELTYTDGATDGGAVRGRFLP
jgi:hypothetical protein